MSVALDVKPTGAVHPLAALFPTLSDVELQELADDIAANGLRQSIVLDVDGQAIDGRNRLAACERAGVAPTFTGYDGDPIAYVVSANLQRRHLSQGQRAALIARAAKFSSRKSQGKGAHAKAAGVSASNVSKATAVEAADPTMLDAVIAGDLGLEAAYTSIKQEQAEPDADTLPAVDATGQPTRGRIVDGKFVDIETGHLVFDPAEYAAAQAESAKAEKLNGTQASKNPKARKAAPTPESEVEPEPPREPSLWEVGPETAYGPARAINTAGHLQSVARTLDLKTNPSLETLAALLDAGADPRLFAPLAGNLPEYRASLAHTADLIAGVLARLDALETAPAS